MSMEKEDDERGLAMDQPQVSWIIDQNFFLRQTIRKRVFLAGALSLILLVVQNDLFGEMVVVVLLIVDPKCCFYCAESVTLQPSND